MTNTQILLDPAAELWRSTRDWAAELCAAFGGPERIARRACRAFKRALALLESIVMKLLLIEAARLHPARAPSPRATATQRTPSRRRLRAPEDPANADTWRVRFNPRLPRGCAAPQRQVTLKRAHAYTSAGAKLRRMARRFEALRRVLADPRRAIAALARKLHARAAGAYATALRIARFTPRGGGGMLHARALVCACDCAVIFRGSG